MKKRIPLLLACLLLPAACTTVSIEVAFPRAPAVALPGVKTLGVVELAETKGPDIEATTSGLDLAEDLTQAIDKSGRFLLLERTVLSKALSELALSSSDLFDDAGKARKIGGMVGADGLVVGRVRVYKYEEHIERHETFWSKIAFWSDSESFHHVRRGEAKVEFSAKVMDVASGMIHANRTIYETVGDDEEAKNEDPPPLDRIALLRTARMAAVKRYAAAICPGEGQESVRLHTGAGLLGLGRFLGLGTNSALEVAIDYAEDRNWPEARAAFRNAAAKPPEGDAIQKGLALWNLALVHACTHSFADAKTTLEQARALLPDESKGLSETLAWINEREADYDKLVKSQS